MREQRRCNLVSLELNTLVSPCPLTLFDPIPEMLDYDVPSDDEDYDPARDQAFGSVGAPTPRADGVASSPAPFGENGGDDGESARGDNDDSARGSDEDEEGGSGYDSDLANEINKGLEAMDKTDEDEDESEDGDGGLFGSGSDDDEEEEAMGVEAEIDPVEMEQRKRIKLLAEEMGDLDKAIASKETELKKAANPIFKVCSIPFFSDVSDY